MGVLKGPSIMKLVLTTILAMDLLSVQFCEGIRCHSIYCYGRVDYCEEEKGREIDCPNGSCSMSAMIRKDRMTLIGLERGCGPEIRKTSAQDSIGCLPISAS